MRNTDPLDKELSDYFHHQDIKDDGFSETIFTELNTEIDQQRLNARLVVTLVIMLCGFATTGVLLFSLVTAGLIEIAAFSGIVMATTFFCLEPEI